MSGEEIRVSFRAFGEFIPSDLLIEKYCLERYSTIEVSKLHGKGISITSLRLATDPICKHLDDILIVLLNQPELIDELKLLDADLSFMCGIFVEPGSNFSVDILSEQIKKLAILEVDFYLYGFN